MNSDNLPSDDVADAFVINNVEFEFELESGKAPPLCIFLPPPYVYYASYKLVCYF